MTGTEARPYRAAAPLRLFVVPFLLLVGLAGALWITASSADARGLKTGFGDPIYQQVEGEERDLWFDRSVRSGASVVRVYALWSSIASAAEPGNPADPADPAYDFSRLDQTVTEASARGLTVLMSTYSAPEWAQGANRPAWAEDYPGSWRPNVNKFRSFAEALTTRYSGRFEGLPRVRLYEPWNEPNLPYFLSPQWSKGKTGGRPIGAEIYRRLLNAFHTAAHSVSNQNVVVGPATGPYGGRSQGRTRPAAFLRQLLCLKDRKELVRASCPEKAKLDRLSHHPITTSGGSGTSAIHPDDAATPDMARLVRILRAAERKKTVRPAGRRAVWATELWWSTDPPDFESGVSPGKQARWIQDSFFRLWQAGVGTVLYYLIADRAFQAGTWHGRWAGTGIYFLDGRPKPSQRASRFPFVARNEKGGRLMLWTRAPEAGRVVFERKVAGGWRKLVSAAVDDGQVVTRKLRRPAPNSKLRLRARLADESSLTWVQN